MYCKNCGSQINADSKFCEKCGSQIEQSVINSSNFNVDQQQNENQVQQAFNEGIKYESSNQNLTNTQSKKNIGKVLNVICIVLFVLLITGCANKTEYRKENYPQIYSKELDKYLGSWTITEAKTDKDGPFGSDIGGTIIEYLTWKIKFYDSNNNEKEFILNNFDSFDRQMISLSYDMLKSKLEETFNSYGITSLYIGNFDDLNSSIYYPKNIDMFVLKNSNLYLDIETKSSVVYDLAKALNDQYPNSLNFIISDGYVTNGVKVSYIKGQKTLNSLSREELEAQL